MSCFVTDFIGLCCGVFAEPAEGAGPSSGGGQGAGAARGYCAGGRPHCTVAEGEEGVWGSCALEGSSG